MDIFKPPKDLVIDDNIVENWKKFQQSFEIYLKASGRHKSKDEVKAAILLNFIGEDALQLFNTFGLPVEKQRSVQEIIKAFDAYIIPRKNVIYERFLFYNRNQKEGEDVEHFVAEIKRLSSTCEFGEEYKDDMLRDRIVLGIRSRQLQERLLRTENLTLVTAINICRASEISQNQVKSLRNEQVNAVELQKHSRKSKPNVEHFPSKNKDLSEMNKGRSCSKNSYLCKKCNQNHSAGLCPAFGKKCLVCGKLNHFAVGCKYKTFNKNSRRQVQEVKKEDNDSETEDIGQFLAVHQVTKRGSNQWFQKILINNIVEIEFKLDTGSEVNLIPINEFKRMSDQEINLEHNESTLEAYGGFLIKPIGKVNLTCSVNKNRKMLEFSIVNSKSPPILGLQACIELGLIKKINTVTNMFSNKEQFVKNNNEVFQGMGLFPDKYQIKVDNNVEGIIKPPRRLPQTLLSKLKVELKKLEKLKIISKVDEPKQWASNLVIVEKK